MEASVTVRGIVSREARLEAMVGPPGAWKATRDFQKTFLLRNGLSPEKRVLDIGCGPLRVGTELIQYLDAGRYTGVDVRSEVIDEAHRQVARHRLSAKNPVLLVSSEFGAERVADSSIDIAWTYSVLFHLTDELVADYFTQVSRVLSPDGVAFANVGNKQAAGEWKEFPFVAHSIDFYRELASARGLDTENLGSLANLGIDPSFRPGHLMLRITRTVR